MKELKFRDLKPEEIEVRVGNGIKDKQGNVVRFNLMLYKTARTDSNLLDETVGAYNWKNSYYQVKNTMVCSISIYDEDKHEWVNKDNGGDDDFSTEQVKAELSDSMKRAGFNLGIGRKLYSASKLYLVVDITDENTMKSRFAVTHVAYDETSITEITIINTKTKKEVINIGKGKKVPTQAEKPQNKASNISDEQYEKDVAIINTYYDSVPDTKKKQFADWIYNATSYNTLDDLFKDKAKTHRIAEVIRDNGK